MTDRLMCIREQSIGKAWEAAVLYAWSRGTEVYTEYDEKSKDVVGCIEVLDPLSQPIVHKAVFAWHRKNGYTREIMEGIEDGRIGKDWWYTYHQRLFGYPAGTEDYPSPPFVDQVDYIVKKLKETPYSRRAQAITWSPVHDPWVEDPPCLQRVWCRIIEDELEMHTYWRSRDLWKAWWLNVYAFTRMQREMAEEIGCSVGKYIDVSSALHLYERDYEQIRNNFVKICETRDQRDRYFWDKE